MGTRFLPEIERHPNGRASSPVLPPRQDLVPRLSHLETCVIHVHQKPSSVIRNNSRLADLILRISPMNQSSDKLMSKSANKNNTDHRLRWVEPYTLPWEQR